MRLNIVKKGFLFPYHFDLLCIFYWAVLIPQRHAAAISRRKCISKLINTGRAHLEHAASFFRDNFERAGGATARGLRNRCFWYSASFSSFFFLLQHHMSGLGKLMNYPHRGRDGACKLHYPTSHNMELFEFIELRVEFSHTDLTHFKIILGPLFSILTMTNWKSFCLCKSEMFSNSKWKESSRHTVMLRATFPL